MYRDSKYICKILLIGLLIVLAGCATPASVRSLSEAQVKAQEGYLQSQKQYFQVIEKYVDAQIATAEELIVLLTKEMNEKQKRLALAAIDSTDKAKTKTAIDTLTANVLTTQKSDQTKLASLKNSSAKLKELHQEILSSLSAILSAQRKLNEYIQLQKADEQAFNQLLSIVGIEKTKVDYAVDSAANILAAIEKNTGKE